MKHTPGPWTVAGVSPFNVLSSDGRMIVNTGRDGSHQTSIKPPEDLANARLIAAAPELLAVLEGYVRTYPNNTRADYARAVIGKATGEK